MRASVLSKFEAGVLILGAAIWLAVAVVPAQLAVVPEYVAAKNAALLLSLIAILLMGIRKLWIGMRCKSAPITLACIFVAYLAAAAPAGDLWAQMRPAPDEGFLYSSSWFCSTHLQVTLICALTEERIYILQTYCMHPESRSACRARENDLFMEKLQDIPDFARALPAHGRFGGDC